MSIVVLGQCIFAINTSRPLWTIDNYRYTNGNERLRWGRGKECVRFEEM